MKKNFNKKLFPISYVAKHLGLTDKKTGNISTHTLRFWETKFTSIRPIKLSGNRRYYDFKQIEKIKLIKFLLKDKGMTIKGVQQILKRNINKLDETNDISVKNEYFKNYLSKKAKNILMKIKKIKHGKKNSS